MAEDFSNYFPEMDNERTIKKDKKNYLLHASLFIATFITTTFAGAGWVSGVLGGPYTVHTLMKGLPYSISIMFIISFHEFGHYFAAVYHKVNATLPFYIPFPPIPYFLNFGTMGAVIKTKSPIHTKKAMFDIGVAGPLSGFVACLIVLLYGFTHVPGVNYLLAIHPDYFSPQYSQQGIDLAFGNNLLFLFLKMIFIHGNQFFPPMSEIYHYPYLCVGWFGLLITAMNMIPVGQLDGGHIVYSMFGKKAHHKIALFSLFMLVAFGISGALQFIDFLKINFVFGWLGWFIWALLLFFVIKIKHPEIYDDSKLGTGRMMLGYISLAIFILSFSPSPFYGTF
jgi:hypothetical protein